MFSNIEELDGYSNLYANRVYSEHPISLYTLDDNAAYLSLISKSGQQGVGWEVVNEDDGFIDTFFVVTGQVPPTEFVAVFYPPEEEKIVEWISPEEFSLIDLNQELKTFAISLYLYQDSDFVDWYEFGYTYFDEFLGADKYVSTRISALSKRDWLNFSFTYSPSEYTDNNVRFFIRASIFPGGTSFNDYSFRIKDFSAGQWAETTFSENLGSFKIETPLDYDGVKINQYGLQDNPGYYIVEDNNLLAKNVGLPMVFGSQSSTKLIPSSEEGTPSMIIPSEGFMSLTNKYREYSLEFWLKINPTILNSKKILGPLNSDNGLYIEKNYISLVVGDSVGSHNISHWNKPMLVHIVLKNNEAILMIDSEIVVQLSFNQLKSLFSEDEWIGFFSYDDIEQYSVDCISIYPYPVSEEVAKRRFAWGQATSSPETIAKYYQGENYYINFSNAEYDTNVIYPDLFSWTAGYSDNLSVSRSAMANPKYSLPEIEVGSKTIQELYLSNKSLNADQEKLFFTFRPLGEQSQWLSPSYMFFDSLNFIDRLSSFYGLVSLENTQDFSPLVLIFNSLNNNSFSIFIENDKIFYKFNDQVLFFEDIDIVLDEENPEIQQESFISFGINFSKIYQKYKSTIGMFFESRRNLQAYLFGNKSETFSGKIYKFGFSNQFNNKKIKDSFNQDGFVLQENFDFLYSHYATYTIVPFIKYDRFFLDISISSYWEESFPLSKFATFVNNLDGKKYYDLDYFQLNIDSPPITERLTLQSPSTPWTYFDLFDFFNFPTQQQYEILDNPLFSKFETYEDLNNNSQTQFILSTDQANLRSYMTFQLLSDGANIDIDKFPYTKSLSDCCFIDADLENNSQSPFKSYLTKFEFIDKTVIYPPKKININRVAAVVHLEIEQDGILTNPFKVRNFEIASKSFSRYQPNHIGTESSKRIFPYTKEGVYFNYKDRNPIRISKERNPYLYLSEDFGIKILGEPSLTKEVGIGLPVNANLQSGFSVQSLQLWVKYDARSIPSTTYSIFEILSLNESVEFVIRPDDSNKRMVLGARNKFTKRLKEDVVFYQNGKRVKNIFLENNEWVSIGIAFEKTLDFDSYLGYINFFKNVAFNNVSYFDTRGMSKSINSELREWSQVLDPTGSEEVDWEYWYVDEETQEIRNWSSIYVLKTSEFYSITPKEIYNSFTGTSNIIFDDTPKNLLALSLGTTLFVESDSSKFFESLRWNEYSIKPS